MRIEKNMKLSDVKRFALIGSGDMGHGIAELVAMAGYPVTMYDIKQEFVDRGIGKIKESLAKMVSKQKVTQEAMDDMMSGIRGSIVLDDAVADVDFVIEAVPEILELKLKVFKDLDRGAPKHAILASNTSNMSITRIGEATKRPDKVVGMHFFNPPAMMQLVEIIRGQKTSDETVKIARELVDQMKNFRGAMVPVLVQKDRPGFIYNRLVLARSLFLNVLLDRGMVTPAGVDAKVRSQGAPMGPYETMDFTGIDVMVHGHKYFHEALSAEINPSGWALKKIEAGQLGKKTGKGIYEWPGGARPTIDLSKPDPDFDPMDIVCLQINEGTKLMEEGICDSAAEIDKAIVYGGGLPGPFAQGKDMGWARVAERCQTISKQLGIGYFMPTETLRRGNIGI
jgi:enoyl-CoA hydratase / 3-hydroxyacyl-CoA dehydrogenase